ncbi:MAG: leucyl/phenylalanyl-tRNA--protein transferase [Bacteroidales bacterium]|nr:leucyl/phenylalanyl-tRNA--protein transferase [Bacteroidales bacterium]
MAVYRLDRDLWFPNPYDGEQDGLVAIGGDLLADRLLFAYCNGFFPWFSYRDSKEPFWYCPLNRFVIFPEEIHISHSMKQLIKQERYLVTVNKDFNGVINGCATANNRIDELGAWLGEDMIKAYTRLHNYGFVFSVEVWEREGEEKKRGRLVGGLYGVGLGKCFFGESMFSLVPNASKLALIHLAKMLRSIGGKFIDCQFETPHLKSMGGRYIPYERYMELLREDCEFMKLKKPDWDFLP